MKNILSFLIVLLYAGNSFSQGTNFQNNDSLTHRFKHGPIHLHDTTETKTYYADSLLHYADKFLGVPYIMAGQSPTGFDCSGFTMYCFRHFDIHLPHSAHEQAKLGKEILLEDIKPGDLLFFKGHNIEDNTIHHVALAVHHEGNKIRFIHSASHSVHYNFLEDPYYGPRFVKAKRVYLE